MPELPEVETNRRNLAAWAEGRRLVAVTPPPGERETGGLSRRAFVARLKGREVEGVIRRGKWILVRRSGGAGLGLHLGMTGKIVRGAGPRFSRAAFHLDDGAALHFVDSRRFGKLRAARRYEELLATREIADLGPDALEELDAAGLSAALARTRRPVKDALMDQRLLARIIHHQRLLRSHLPGILARTSSLGRSHTPVCFLPRCGGARQSSSAPATSRRRCGE